MANTELDYNTALNQAFWRKISKQLTGRCNDLLSFNRVLKHLRDQPYTDLGIQTIPLERIIGSSGRIQDYDLSYTPSHREQDNRWIRVADAYQQGIELPPIRVYKVGDAYFVEDGNHRVSVARYYKETHITASVIEIDASSLIPKHTCTRLGYKV
jgi:hypothetical protein